MTNFDLDNEIGRSKARLALGAAGYDAAMQEREIRNQFAVVHGHVLQRSQTERWGEVITVGDTGVSFVTIEQATKYASENPRRDQP